MTVKIVATVGELTVEFYDNCVDDSSTILPFTQSPQATDFVSGVMVFNVTASATDAAGNTGNSCFLK
jgi:hypothetical protein